MERHETEQKLQNEIYYSEWENASREVCFSVLFFIRKHAVFIKKTMEKSSRGNRLTIMVK